MTSTSMPANCSNLLFQEPCRPIWINGREGLSDEWQIASVYTDAICHSSVSLFCHGYRPTRRLAKQLWTAEPTAGRWTLHWGPRCEKPTWRTGSHPDATFAFRFWGWSRDDGSFECSKIQESFRMEKHTTLNFIIPWRGGVRGRELWRWVWGLAKSRWELAILGSMSCFLKGLSGGTWPEKSKEHLTTYTYPKAIWTFLQKHSSYDIERVAQDVVKRIETTDAICHWCVQPRIVGKDYYEDGSWYCKSCFLSWQGIGPRGMSDKGRLNKSKKGKFSLQQGCKGEESQRQETLTMIGRWIYVNLRGEACIFPERAGATAGRENVC